MSVELPLFAYISDIHSCLRNGHNLVLQAEPGAGKSTVLPLSLLESDWLQGKKILMLEPRRIAAKSIAYYLSQQLGELIGQRVGYHIKQDRKVSCHTVLEIITEGILTRRLQADPELPDVGLIIFDEFHERSLHSDLSLILALDIQQSIREDLRLLVMSATINTKKVADYLSGSEADIETEVGVATEIIECPGRAYPVEVRYQESKTQYTDAAVMEALHWVFLQEDKGDVLVFLPGQKDIQQCLKSSRESFSDSKLILFLALFGGQSIELQEKAILPDSNGRQRVIFTTNIAETSLTIQGVSWVIDSGLEKALVLDPSSGMTRLQTRFISKASAEQRKGRAGRIKAGKCIRLWSEVKHKTLNPFQGEEILSADLSGLVLELAAWGSLNMDGVNWLTPPPKPHFDSARVMLETLSLINPESKQITLLGKKAIGLGLAPRLAAMLLQAQCGIEKIIACELAVLLSERDILPRNHGSDIVERLLALQEYKADKKKYAEKASYQYVKPSTLAQILSAAKLLKRRLGISEEDAFFGLQELQRYTGKLLILAYPDRLAKCRSKNDGRYQLVNGKGVFLFEDDPLFGEEWLVVADCDGQRKEGRIYRAAPLSFETIMLCTQNKQNIQEKYFYDARLKKVLGKRVRELGAIVLKETTISVIPPEQFQSCLIQLLEKEGLLILDWTPQCQNWLDRAGWLSLHVSDFPAISSHFLIETVDDWLLPYLSGVASIADLKKVRVLPLLKALMSWGDQQRLEKEAPESYITPGNRRIAIDYSRQQGPMISVVLQEMFGEQDSPRLADGKIPLRFELLSPARRPIQTTSDLRQFWSCSYFDVIKEMKGRYPKHRWPENPLQEKPGKSIKG